MDPLFHHHHFTRITNGKLYIVREKRYQDVFARNIGKGFLRQIPNLL